MGFASRLCIQWRMGCPRITVTSARTATASLVERRGEGVDRRAAHQGPLAGERLWRGRFTKRRVERRVEPPPLPVEAAVETVSEDLVEDALMSHLIGPPRPGSRGLAPARSLPLEPLSCLRCAGVLRSAYWR